MDGKKERAAYNYYCESRRRNKHEPLPFMTWRRMVPDSQIEDMCRLYNLLAEEPQTGSASS